MRLLGWMPRLRRAPFAALWKSLEYTGPARHVSSDRYASFDVYALEERRVLCAGAGVSASPDPALIAAAAPTATTSAPAASTSAPTDPTTGALLNNLKTSPADGIDDIGGESDSSGDDGSSGNGTSSGGTSSGGAAANGAATGDPGAATAAVAAGADTAHPGVFYTDPDGLSISVPIANASETTTSDQAIDPFAGVTIADTLGNPVTVEIQYDSTTGSLAPTGGFSQPTSGTLTFTGSATDATTAIDALVFTPVSGESVTTGFTISVTDTVTSAFVTDSNTSLTVSDGVSPASTTTVTEPTLNYITDAGVPLVVSQANGVLASDGLTSEPGATLIAGSPSDGTVDLLITGAFTYTPTAGFNGIDSFSYSYSYVSGGTTFVFNGDVDVFVHRFPTGQDQNFTIDATSPVTPVDGIDLLAGATGNGTLSVDNLTGPANGTLTLVSGSTYNYTPNAGFVGTDTVTYNVFDGVADSATVTLTITVDPLPTGQNQNFTVDATTPVTPVDSIDLLAGATGVGTLTPFGISRPTDGTLTLVSGSTYDFTPHAGFVGTETITYEVSDGRADSATVTLTITVDPLPTGQNQNFTIDSTSPVTPVDGINLLAGATGDGTLSVVNLTGPANGTLTLVSGSTYNYTPPAAFVGTDTVTYNVFDGISDSATVTLKIAVDPLPTGQNQNFTIDATTPVTSVNGINLLAGATGDGTLSVANLTGPSNGTLTLVSGSTYNYKPTAGFTGTDTVTYDVFDGIADSATVTLTIMVDPLPTGQNQNFTIDATTPVTTVNGINLLAGATGDGTLSVASLSGPSHGTLALVSGSTYNYKPTAGFTGTDTVTYKVFDGIADSATVTLTITSDPLPTGRNQNFTIDTTTTVPSINLLAGATGDGTLSVANLTGPANGALTLISGSTYSYAPTAGFTGADTITYNVFDGIADSALVTVTITVDPLPTGQDQNFTIDATTPVTPVNGINLLAAATGDGTLSVANLTGPSNGTFTLVSGTTYNYTPAAGFTGTDTITYDVFDGRADSATVTVTIVVNPLPTGMSPPPLVTDTNTPITSINLLAGAMGHGSLRVVDIVDPTHGTLTLVSGSSYTYTPDANFSGPDSFSFEVSDGIARSPAIDVTISVLPFLTGTQSGQIVNDNQTIMPFQNVVIADQHPQSPNPEISVVIQLSDLVGGGLEDGSLAEAPGYAGAATFEDLGGGQYSVFDVGANVTQAIQNLVFTPTAHLVKQGATETTTFTITVGNGSVGTIYPAATDSSTTVITTDINAAPTVIVAVGGLSPSPDEGSLYSLAGVTFTPGYVNDRYTVSIVWGDGATSVGGISGSTITSAGHTYTTFGAFNVTVTVTDAVHNPADAAASDVNGFSVTVINLPPSITTTLASLTVPVGAAFQLPTIAFTDPGVGDTHTWMVQWSDDGSMDSGSLVAGATTFTDSTTHYFGDVNTYSVTVTVTDNGLLASVVTYNVLVTDVPPIFTSPTTSTVTIDLGQPLTVDFTHPGFKNPVFTYDANFGDGSPSLTNAAVTNLVTGRAGTPTRGVLDYTFADAGTYNVTLTVTDKAGQSVSENLTVVVNDVAPALSVSTTQASVADGTFLAPLNISFSSLSFANPNQPSVGGGPVGYTPTFTYLINWGDGTTSTGVANVTSLGAAPAVAGGAVTPTLGAINLNAPATIDVEHAWPKGGSYTVQVTVFDHLNTASNVANFVETVTEAPPVLTTLLGTPTLPEGSTLSLGSIALTDPTFADLSLATPYTPAFTYTINWGDGTSASLPATITAAGSPGTATQADFLLSHFYASVANYHATLVISDGQGGTLTTPFTVVTTDVAPTISALSFSQISSDNMTTATGSVYDPGSTSLTLTINWGDGMQTIIPQDTGQQLPGATVDTFSVSHIYLGNPNPDNPAAPINASVVASDQFSGVTTVAFAVPLSGTGIVSVSVQQPPPVNILAVAQTVVAQTPSYVAPVILNVANAEAVVVHTEQTNVIEDQVVLRVVNAIGKESANISLPAKVLDDLPGLFRRLPDGHYRVFFLQSDSNRERVLMDVQIRAGRPVDADDESGTQDRPPSAQIDPPPALQHTDRAAVEAVPAIVRGGSLLAAAPTASELAAASFAASESGSSAASESGSAGRQQRPSPLLGASALAGAALLVAEARNRAASRAETPHGAGPQNPPRNSVFNKASRLLNRLRTAHREQYLNLARRDRNVTASLSNAGDERSQN